MLQAACWNEQADGELWELCLPASPPLRCEERGTVRGLEWRQEECGCEAVIKGGTEGGGREIRVNKRDCHLIGRKIKAA